MLRTIQTNHWQILSQSLSVLGNPIQVFAPQQFQKLDWFIFSGIHGDEKESIILAKALMQALERPEYNDLNNYAICPLLNPDGFLSNQRQNHNQVDLNRNFPTKNWELNQLGEHYYSGPTPASELETQFLIEFIERYAPKNIISIHTPYRVINYDGPALELAEKLAKFNHYPVEASIGYPTPGSFGTYTGIERNIPVLTLELPENEDFNFNELSNNLQGIIELIKAS